MEALWKQALWRQFGGAIDALRLTIERCPEALWYADRDGDSCWYLVYHTLFWLDLYLSGSVEGFEPPEPFGLEELDPAGIIPPEPYSKEQMLEYLEHCRRKCRQTITDLDAARASIPSTFGWGTATFVELLIYNLRHVQHGTGQMNLRLRQHGHQAAPWVAQAGD